ncbi:MAG: hypothetical protein AAGJ46_13675 [Planctomycetota bacterium]
MTGVDNVTGIDIVCILLAILGGTMLLATGAGIATQHVTKIPDATRRLDGYLSGGVLTLVARFLEGWPTANRSLKTLFAGSLAACVLAFGLWLLQ